MILKVGFVSSLVFVFTMAQHDGHMNHEKNWEMDFKNAPKEWTSNFREDETKLLIQLWGNSTVQNKLYLTHRKAPVMRLIAENMQKHGFYRTPDEIKTKIRNLKCLYHRNKESTTTGVGIGTVDPDWPHYKAMDEILSKKNALPVYNHNLLSELNAEVKDKIEDIGVNGDDESYTSNNNGSDEFKEKSVSMPATITPLIFEEEERINTHIKVAPKSPAFTSSVTYPRIQIAQNLHNTPQKLYTTTRNTVTLTPRFKTNVQKTIQALQTSMPSNIAISSQMQTTTVPANTVNKNNNPSSPFTLLILNGVQGAQDGTAGLLQKAMNNGANALVFNAEGSNILKEILDIQKKRLEIERERLQVEKQKLEFERAVWFQQLPMVPKFNEIFQKFKEPKEEESKNFEEHPNFNKNVQNGVKRPASDPPPSISISKFTKEEAVNGTRKGLQESTTSHSDTDGDSDSI